jgi:hypothetical protein
MKHGMRFSSFETQAAPAPQDEATQTAQALSFMTCRLTFRYNMSQENFA